MQAQNGAVQFVKPNNHRVNAAKRAIQTFKNHFISSLCTTNPDFPFQLWNHLTEQAVITCNILRRSQLNPDIAAYEQVHGAKYKWTAHPMAPPGTRAVIHSSTLTLCGPALDHYRCSHFYVPDTQAMHISGSFQLYPVHCHLPTCTSAEHTSQVANELVRCMEHLPRATQKCLFTTTIIAIHKLNHCHP